MSDKKKILFLVLIISFVYLVFYYQSGIVSFLTQPSVFFNNLINKSPITNSSSTIVNQTNTTVRVIDEENAVVELVEKSSPAVVSVVRNDVYFDIQQGPVKTQDSIGTGFVIDGKNGIVLTNRHVVDEESVTYSIVTSEEKTFPVDKISRDPLNDFAILKVDVQGAELPQLELGDSSALKAGQTVVAIGNALGEFGNSVTKGIISGLGRGIVAQGGLFGPSEYLDNVIQTDAALNPGNSGGPLLNIGGQVIGINVAVSQSAENIGFSIPINTVKQAIDMFKEKGKIIRPFMGVEYRQVTQDIAETRGLPVGAFVQRVLPDSPADKAGIRAGDIITSIAGVRIDDEQNKLAVVIAKQSIDNPVEVIVDRDGREMKFTVTLKDADEK